MQDSRTTAGAGPSATALVLGVVGAVVAVLVATAPAPDDVLATEAPSASPAPSPVASATVAPTVAAAAPAAPSPPPLRTPAAARQRAAAAPEPVEAVPQPVAPRPDPGTAVADVREVDGPPRARPSARPATSDPRVVVGGDAYLYISQDWTVACQYAGKAREAAAAVAEVTAALREGGRPTVLAIGPNKASVVTEHVPAEGVPKRACGEQSTREYWQALAEDGGPSVIDLRPALRESQRSEQPYWRLDTHWSPTGGTVFASELARAIDPSLLLGLGSERGTYELDGDLARTLGRPEVEQISALATTNRAVSWDEEPQRRVGLRNVVRTTRATAGPGGRVVPGRTVFVGDSFTAIAVAQLAPLFEEAVYVWAVPEDPLQPVLDELVDADRVVLESVERRGWQFRMIQPDVAPALRGLPPRGAQ